MSRYIIDKSGCIERLKDPAQDDKDREKYIAQSKAFATELFSRKIPSHNGDKTRFFPAKPSSEWESVTGKDSRDGSKNIGFFAREEGRYGSHCQYDDYSDEGSAD